ncbi:MAG: DUF4012 domain-containing protein [Patescibacteria group bacterium]|nr:DUF4012 domain-containing protein [Patescibacteria group bacterium]
MTAKIKTNKGKKQTTRTNSSTTKPTQIKIRDQAVKSPHLINLKNPFSGSFEQPKNLSTKFGSQQPKFFGSANQSVPRPPRPPKNGKKSGVDFMSGASFGRNLRPVNSRLPNFFKKNQPAVVQNFSTGLDLDEHNNDEIEDIFAPATTYNFSKFKIQKNWYRQFSFFIILALLAVLPLEVFSYFNNLAGTKNQIMQKTSMAIDNLKAGEDAITKFDLAEAGDKFGLAKKDFTSANDQISQLNQLTTDLINMVPGQSGKFQSGIILLNAGQVISNLGETLASDGKNLLASNNIKEYYRALEKFNDDLKISISQFEQVQFKMEQINLADLPESNRSSFGNILSYLPKIDNGLKSVYKFNSALLKILGQQQWQRYLVIFLNNNEMRATGGFMGSFAIVDVDRGQIKNINIPGGGTYDIQGQLAPKVISPQPLHLINSRWEFQDANWWPDFPTSAKKIEWFYQNAGGPSVDGVVTITSTVMEKLLKIFGPIAMPDYQRVITAENFVTETQKIVELEYDKTINKPKQFLADLQPKLLEKIFNADSSQLVELTEILKQSLNERQIQLYFNDSDLEALIGDVGWAGRQAKTKGDFLSVINTNLAGGKTDGIIDQTITHRVSIGLDGSLIDTVKLTKHHNGIKGKNIFTGVQNNSYIRFYVPQGSNLMSATGFEAPPAKLFEKSTLALGPDLDLLSYEGNHTVDTLSGTDIYNENGFTVFGNWLMIKPGETKTVEITYKLPDIIQSSGLGSYFYTLLIQKQSGSNNVKFVAHLDAGINYDILSKYPPQAITNTSSLDYSGILQTDLIYGAILNKK